MNKQKVVPFHFVVIDYEFLLQDFDGVEIRSLFFFGKHDLPEIPFAEDSKEVEIVQSNPSFPRWLSYRLLLLLLHWCWPSGKCSSS